MKSMVELITTSEKIIFVRFNLKFVKFIAKAKSLSRRSAYW